MFFLSFLTPYTAIDREYRRRKVFSISLSLYDDT